MGEEANYTGGIALIVEGATEKVFYSELIRLRALVHGATVERTSDIRFKKCRHIFYTEYVSTRFFKLFRHIYIIF